MSEKMGNKVYETIHYPATEEQEMSLIFYFESPRKDVAKVMLEHQARWIIKELKEYPMSQRKAIYEKTMKKLDRNSQ